MNEPGRAVFLSYTREDADTVRRLANALATAGVEVWLDESELHGGDAWDANIRRQIHECALFVPIISAHTEARKEGYFRREWKLAVDRLDDIAEGIPFLVPVCIDGTPERTALAPAAFLRVQWTRLRPDDAPDAFVRRVQQLLGQSDDGHRTAEDGRQTAGDRHQKTGLGGQGVESARRGWQGGAKWPLVAAAALVIGGGAYFALRPVTKEAAPTPVTSRPTAAQPPTEFAPANSAAKSIAVLPFSNMSEDKDASAFFSDGMHEDILTNLALIRELRVTSRTTAMQYRDTKKTLREIGAELGVAYVLEGSVRRAGNRVRVTGQLIRAATDEHVWAKSFDRDLTDIFAIQSELATEIAGALQTVLTPQERTLLASRPTGNPAAYEHYLKARDIMRSLNVDRLPAAERSLEAAVQLDPQFSAAWGLLAVVRVQRDIPNGAAMARAKEALDTAVRVAPDSPEVIRAVGDYHYYGFRDYARAAEQYGRILGLQPNNADAYEQLSAIKRRQGRWLDALADMRKAVELDAGKLNVARSIAITLEAGRRYPEATAERARVAKKVPGNFNEAFALAHVSFRADGGTKAVEEFFARLSPSELSSDTGVSLQRQWAMVTGNLDGVERLDRLRPDPLPLRIAVTLAAKGDRGAARKRLEGIAEKIRADLATNPASDRMWANLAEVEALLGDKDQALQSARKAIELVPESRDAFIGPLRGASLAFVHAWTGDVDRAVAEYARLLRVPFGGQNVHEMKRSPWYFPLQSDPRFQALLNDPKNNAPLF